MVSERCMSAMPSCADPRIWLTEWVDQRFILQSGAVGVFLSHGGLNSIQEAAVTATPIVVMPIFADQVG